MGARKRNSSEKIKEARKTQAIYSLRNQLLEEEDISETINNLIGDQFNIVTNSFVPVESVES